MKPKMKVLLNGIEKVKTFVNVATAQDYDISLQSGRYVIDAKSIMGIFSLDLSKPIDLCVDSEGVDAEAFKAAFASYAMVGDM